MPRKPRKLRTQIPMVYTDKFIAHLKLFDFLGKLSKEEISIAKKLGVYKWDEWTKKRRAKKI